MVKKSTKMPAFHGVSASTRSGMIRSSCSSDLFVDLDSLEFSSNGVQVMKHIVFSCSFTLEVEVYMAFRYSQGQSRRCRATVCKLGYTSQK